VTVIAQPSSSTATTARDLAALELDDQALGRGHHGA
jgi:hypothetical protein